MKKGVLVGVVVVVMLGVAGVAYYFISSSRDDKKTVTVNTTTTDKQGEQETKQEQVEVTKATDIATTVSAWEKAGLTVSEGKEALYQMINAKAGVKYDVGDTNVELYEFEDATKANEAKTSYFTDEASTSFVTGTLVVVIHSTDSEKVDPIKAVF